MATTPKFTTASQKVLDAISSGHTQSAAAAIAGVSTIAVSDWKRQGRLAIEQNNNRNKYAIWYKKFLTAQGHAKAAMENVLFKQAQDKGNVSAAIKWLSKQYPDEWGDTKTVDVNVSGGIDVTNHYAGVSDEDLREQLREAATRRNTGNSSGAGPTPSA